MIFKIISKYSLHSSYFDVAILLINSFSNNISNETRDINLINIATMDRKHRKGMYTNTFLHFLLAYNQVKQGPRTINI